jgi:ssDNA-binding Zn-finger/Zn-ribbon topoisomerase 1
MSDLLSSISQAMALATRLRSKSEKLKETEFKQLADALLLELAEMQLKLDDLMSDNVAMKGQLQAQANPQGECCPRCGELGWRVSSTKPHKTPGVMVQTYTCPKCRLKEETLIEPK